MESLENNHQTVDFEALSVSDIIKYLESDDLTTTNRIINPVGGNVYFFVPENENEEGNN